MTTSETFDEPVPHALRAATGALWFMRVLSGLLLILGVVVSVAGSSLEEAPSAASELASAGDFAQGSASGDTFSPPSALAAPTTLLSLAASAACGSRSVLLRRSRGDRPVLSYAPKLSPPVAFG